jgi:hypothetical protein
MQSAILPQVMENVMGHTMILAHRELFILSLAITLVISSLCDTRSTSLREIKQKKSNTYIVLVQPGVTLDSATWHKVIAGVDPVPFRIPSRWMPFSWNLQELFHGIRVSHG